MSVSAAFIAALAGGGHSPDGLPSAAGIAFDSRRVRPGDAFFALPGANGHGVDHADEALERGASFVVSDRRHRRALLVEDSRQALFRLAAHARSRITGPVVGISGSAGKTSTRAFVSAAIGGKSSRGNLNTPYAIACLLVDAWLESPHAPLVVEMGIDRVGEMDELTALVRPSHGLLTAIGESHLEGLGDLAGVAREKAKLLWSAPERLASAQAAGHISPVPPGLLRYGFDEGLEVSGLSEAGDGGGRRVSALGTTVELQYPGGAMALNALGALAVAWSLGVPTEVAARRIETAKLEPGRLQRKQLDGRLVIDDSYNSNPASASEALEALSELPRPHVAILGDMLELGKRSEELHRELGRATRGLDAVFAVGPHSRLICEENPAARHVDSAEQVLPLLDQLPKEGTLLVKASRGVRLERVVAALEGRRVET